MVDTVSVMLGVGVILFLGFFAEFLFKKINIPDVLFLIIIGFAIGPYGFGYVNPESVKEYAPLFTTFALLFLLYDGAFNINLKSLARGAVKSLKVTFFNFFVSSIMICLVMLIIRYDFLTSLLTGFILGGVSSAFVMPLLKQLKVEGEIYSVLALESAITDVLCIVFAFTVMEVISLNVFNFQVMISKIAALFAIAGLVGIIAGIVWIIIVARVFKEHKSYMITIAYLLLIYWFTEFLQGNGAIAALFFGLMLKNSKELAQLFGRIANKKEKGDNVSMHSEDKAAEFNGKYSISATTESEQFFYSQISFFLKTFFFVYIGLLFNLSDTRILLLGGTIAVMIMMSRMLSKFITKEYNEYHRKLIQSIFARGLAAAAIAQVVFINKIPYAEDIIGITYAVIVFTIILSSVRVFILAFGHTSKQNHKVEVK
ncbi:hypothetical protein COV19_00715 [Candidatus Woesearchaeota archaeon CG10_big_fil_rev_8_21_14_0_10_44_13]|nr:MAG: hypothetical protein COV19_00715 [Candidatus Woesearchaeota archaeon CG10_big_fil_rev_8_21_14_0_10_44_13]